jgi:hypothetical protein
VHTLEFTVSLTTFPNANDLEPRGKEKHMPVVKWEEKGFVTKGGKFILKILDD